MRFVFIALAIFLAPVSVQAESEYVRGEVIEVQRGENSEFGGIEREEQNLIIKLLDGEKAGEHIKIETNILNGRVDMKTQEGENLVLEKVQLPSGGTEYQIREKYRLPSLIVLTVIFFGLGILLAGRTGFTSILGLAVSIGILAFFVVPKILDGGNPLLISLIGSVLIACTSLYLAHGWNRRTTIALYSTILTLAISTLMAVIFVYAAKLFGMGTEEAVFLQIGAVESVNLRGLLLGGIIIGALGVLDDITTAQTAAIDELSKANHKLGAADLYKSGTSIGREHIASLINSLALAYVGASLPMFLLFAMNSGQPWWVIVNSEFIAEEVVRTLVGSSTLLLAVPISTWFAARAFAHGNHTSVEGGHPCVH